MLRNKKNILCLLFILSLSILMATDYGKEITFKLQSKGIPKELIVVLISMLPIVELRGAIPIAIGLLGMSWWESAIYAIIGNMIPIPFVLLLMDKVANIFYKWKYSAKFMDWLFARTRRKGKLIEYYKEIGLTLFVAVPLPVTGAWTGSLAAYIFGLKFWKSMLCALLGVIIASIVVTLITLGVVNAIN